MACYSVFHYEPSALLRVSDEDAAEFLQSQFTNDLRPFQPGTCRYGLFLDVKGKILADAFILCRGPEDFLVVSPTSEAAVIEASLERHIIADDVEVESWSASATALIGVGADAAFDRLGIPVPEHGRFSQKDGLLGFRGRRARTPSFECLALDATASASLKHATDEAESAAGWWIQAQRLEAGYPLIPVEAGPGDLPGECGLEADTVSFTKGCFLGQEVVARMHNVGRAQRGLFFVQGPESPPDFPKDLFNDAGKKVGQLRSAYMGATGWTGVAMLKLRHAMSGERLSDGAHELTVMGPMGGSEVADG